MIPKISVIVLNYNGRELLERFFPSILAIDYPNIEIIVIDNHSTDDSINFMVNEYHPPFRITKLDRNWGTAKAYNIGAKLAKGEYLFFLSNDIKVEKDVLTELIKNKSDICTATILKMNGKIDNVGSDIDILGFPSVKTVPDNKPPFASCGSAMLIKKSVFEEIGGYDDDYFSLGDDIDLSWRARMYGYTVGVEITAIVYHLGDVTFDKTHTRVQRRYMSERNGFRTLLKNYSSGYLLFMLPLYLLLLSAEIIFFLLIFKPQLAKCGIKAIYWNWANFDDTMRRRAKVQNMRRVKDKEIFKLMQKVPKKIRMFFDFIFNRHKWKGYFR